MPGGIVPESFLGLLAAFAGCFGGPSYRNFESLVVGWVQCLGRRTITAVALASGAVGARHISVFHRFFARATWSLDAVGRVLFALDQSLKTEHQAPKRERDQQAAALWW